MTAVNDGTALLGRVLLAVIFVLGGFQKLFDFAGTIGYMKAEGLTLPTLAAIIAILVECVGGVLVIAGYQTRLVGIVLAAWCIATALVGHRDFANLDQMIHFLKNVAMAGGFLQLFAFGAGNWSIDARQGRGVAKTVA